MCQSNAEDVLPLRLLQVGGCRMPRRMVRGAETLARKPLHQDRPPVENAPKHAGDAFSATQALRRSSLSSARCTNSGIRVLQVYAAGVESPQSARICTEQGRDISNWRPILALRSECVTLRRPRTCRAAVNSSRVLREIQPSQSETNSWIKVPSAFLKSDSI